MQKFYGLILVMLMHINLTVLYANNYDNYSRVFSCTENPMTESIFDLTCKDNNSRIIYSLFFNNITLKDSMQSSDFDLSCRVEYRGKPLKKPEAFAEMDLGILNGLYHFIKNQNQSIQFAVYHSNVTSLCALLVKNTDNLIEHNSNINEVTLNIKIGNSDPLSEENNLNHSEIDIPTISVSEKFLLSGHIYSTASNKDSDLLQKLYASEPLNIRERQRLTKVLSDFKHKCRTEQSFKTSNLEFCTLIDEVFDRHTSYIMSLPESTDRDLQDEFGNWLISDEAEYQKTKILLNWAIPGTYLIWGHGTPYRKNILIRINGEWVDFKTGEELFSYLEDSSNNTGYVRGAPIHFVVCHGGVQNTGSEPVFVQQLANAAQVAVKPYSSFVYTSGLRGKFVELGDSSNSMPDGAMKRTYNKPSGKPVEGWIKTMDKRWGEMDWVEPNQ